ncbi:TadE family type IV pilus minor pilin [Arthrobacter sp. Soil782]|uniref:TadE family type IV pilus minor pilin n=1 Tax=Arthrobacter sp. Soil782 TaxID=1736410 RepID=UPI0012F98329|nr:TadE family type IV pilus minor pilin [Arthrobacter sp. Soil782]
MTAEVAVALPAVVVLLAVVLGAAALGLSQLRIEEAARAGAREIMRGESSDVVEGTVRRIAGEQADIAVQSNGSTSTVTVNTAVDVPVLELLDVSLSARAVALPEQE